MSFATSAVKGFVLPRQLSKYHTSRASAHGAPLFPGKKIFFRAC
jgi:hypothetical protein